MNIFLIFSCTGADVTVMYLSRSSRIEQRHDALTAAASTLTLETMSAQQWDSLNCDGSKRYSHRMWWNKFCSTGFFRVIFCIDSMIWSNTCCRLVCLWSSMISYPLAVWPRRLSRWEKYAKKRHLKTFIILSRIRESIWSIRSWSSLRKPLWSQQKPWGKESTDEGMEGCLHLHLSSMLQCLHSHSIQSSFFRLLFGDLDGYLSRNTLCKWCRLDPSRSRNTWIRFRCLGESSRSRPSHCYPSSEG